MHNEAVVRAHGSDVPAIARVLGQSRSTLYEKIRRTGLNLERPEPRSLRCRAAMAESPFGFAQGPPDRWLRGAGAPI